jgi:hypothetical protein
MAAVAVVATVFSAVSGFVGQKKQQKAMRQAANEERKQRDIANRQQALERQRSIRQSIAQARVMRARAIQAGYASGGGFESSGAAGAASAMSVDMATAIGSSNTQFGAATGIAASQNQQSAFMQQAQGNTFTDLSQLAGVFGNASTNRGLSNFSGIGKGGK